MSLLLSKLFLAATIKYGLPPGLLASICFVESGYKITAIHYDDGNQNSVGVCQLHLSTARMMGFKGTEKQLMRPQTNIKYAAAYLQHQLKRYHGDVNKSIISYNRGSAKNLTYTPYGDKIYKRWGVHEVQMWGI